MVDKVIAVTSLLIGQVGETESKVYRNGKTSVILIILWIFGNYILMANLYQGSIYSCFTVPILPQTPVDVKDLLNWKIPVVAVDTFPVYDAGTWSDRTLLDNYVIPQLITSGEHNPIFDKFLSNFQKILLSFTDDSVARMIDNVLHGRSSLTQPTIVLMMQEVHLDNLMQNIKFIGNRQITKNRGYSPFRHIAFYVGGKNLLAPYYAKEWARLGEARLSQMWNKVTKINFLLRLKREQLGDLKYFDGLQNSFGAPKLSEQFHEATAVSVELMTPTFFIFAVMTGLGLIGFLMENKVLFLLKYWLIQSYMKFRAQ